MDGNCSETIISLTEMRQYGTSCLNFSGYGKMQYGSKKEPWFSFSQNQTKFFGPSLVNIKTVGFLILRSSRTVDNYQLLSVSPFCIFLNSINISCTKTWFGSLIAICLLMPAVAFHSGAENKSFHFLFCALLGQFYFLNK